jgi:tetratricopeptide (TPR) repeat protein
MNWEGWMKINNFVKKLLIYLVCIFSAGSYFAETVGGISNEPAWISYQKGMYEYSRGEYGKALFYFREALNRNPVMPEAEMAIGDVYMTQGEYVIAEKQYLKAYDERRVFSIPEQTYTVQYKLADLYERWNKYDKMEAGLLAIVNDSQVFTSEKYAFFKRKLQESYLTNGINRMVKLYRLADTFATRAHLRLAVFYYKSGRYYPAFENSIFGVLTVISQAIEELKNWIPDYPENEQYPEFDLKVFLEVGYSYQPVRDYLEDLRIFEELYYLAAISYVQGDLKEANYLWGVIASDPNSGRAGELSKNQIKNPRVAPLLPAED